MSQLLRNSTEPAPYEKITVTRVTGAMGAEIGGVDLATLDDATFAEIHRAWLENNVVFFRNQTMTPAQYLGFAKRWGDIHLHPYMKGMADNPEIFEIIKTETETKNFGNRWHTDQQFCEEPAKATMLYAQETPQAGGDTMFANLYLAYDALSDGMKQMLSGVKGVANGDSKRHDSGMTRAMRAKAGVGQMAQIDPKDIKIQTISTHPVIRTHPETKRKLLYVGGHIERFHGMTDEESDPLKAYLMKHATRPEFVHQQVQQGRRVGPAGRSHDDASPPGGGVELEERLAQDGAGIHAPRYRRCARVGCRPRDAGPRLRRRTRAGGDPR